MCSATISMALSGISLRDIYGKMRLVRFTVKSFFNSSTRSNPNSSVPDERISSFSFHIAQPAGHLELLLIAFAPLTTGPPAQTDLQYRACRTGARTIYGCIRSILATKQGWQKWDYPGYWR